MKYKTLEDAVKHINAPAGTFEKIVGGTDAHKITWLFFRHKRHCAVDHIDKEILRFAYRDASYSKSGKIE